MQVTEDNCYNSSDLAFNLVFTTEDLKSGALRTFATPSAVLYAAVVGFAMLLL